MKAENQLRLVYRRGSNFESYSGSLVGVETQRFTDVSFAAMLELTGAALRAAPGIRLVLKREEAPYPIALPQNIEELLRTDVPAAVAALTVPPQRVVVAPIRAPKNELIGTLRHGYDTLADALGDRVYLKARVGRVAQVEDPVTGRWVSLELREGRPHCGDLPLEDDKLLLGEHGRWVRARTDDILTLGKDRYYLPRRWSDSGWIEHDTLASMYAFYRKEKANVDSR